MNWEFFSKLDLPRLAVYTLIAAAGFVVLIRLLKFAAGVILGFVVTLILAALYYFKIGF